MSKFSSAVVYALSCLRYEHIVLGSWRSSTSCMTVTTSLPGFQLDVRLLAYQLLPFLFDYRSKRVGAAPALELSVVVVISPLVSLLVEFK